MAVPPVRLPVDTVKTGMVASASGAGSVTVYGPEPETVTDPAPTVARALIADWMVEEIAL